MANERVRLAWALVGGTLTHVSKFRGVPYSLRPPAICEACGGGVVIKVGAVRACHYAHKPHTHCALTAPETARHYNSKHLLASKLRSADILGVVAQCAYSQGSDRCNYELASIAAEGWDEVQVETTIDPIRPDISLRKGGVPILAIEVRATNAISEAKAARLDELQLPWIEVAAGPDCDSWSPDSPLRVIRHESTRAARLCPTHAEVIDISGDDWSSNAAATVRRARRTRVSRADLPDHGERWKYRVVDCYPVSGPRVRKVFWVYIQRAAAKWRLRLVEDPTNRVIAVLSDVSASEDALRRLHRRLSEHLRRAFERYYSDKGWQDAAAFPASYVTIYRSDYMPVKYRRGSDGEWAETIPPDV